MLVSKFLDDIQQTATWLLAPAEIRPDRRRLLAWMSSELNELSGKIPDADWWLIWLEPAIRTDTGVREYDLPESFPANFAKLDTERFACNLDDGASEANLKYRRITEYYDQNLRGQTNGRPESYSILMRPDGRRQLLLSPPPDANGSVGYYEVDGLYNPGWDLHDEDELPGIPNNLAVLKYGVLRRISPDLEPKFQEAYAYLLMEIARNRKIRISPNYGDSGNRYARMRI